MDSGDNFDVYVGCKSGVFKGVKIAKKECVMQNIQNLVSITDDDEVTTMSWGDDEEKEILIACGVKGTRSVKVYDTKCSTFTCSFFTDIGKGKINGISRYNGAILTAVHSGEVKLWRFEKEHEILINAGENLNRMRHSKTNKNIIATGGYEHRLQLFDLEKQRQIFLEKNQPNDWLQLKVPIWISDIDFLPTTEQIVAVSKYGHVRLYDPKTQRRPVINLEVEGEALTTLTVTPREKQIIVGSGKGKMNLVDLRKPAKVLNTYKGFAGGITGLACSTSEPYVVSVSLDRYLRIHHIDTKQLLKKVYLTSKISCMLLHSGFSLPTEIETDKDVQICNNSSDSSVKGQKNEADKPDNDVEYDMLFEKMPVILSNKEDRKSIERKRRKTKESSSDEEIISSKFTRRKEKLEKNCKKTKSKQSKHT
ncbi:WD repeat-containing protein 74 isoform X1 [Hylaeus volcanicus]|uniref:WD repeat-containing protein 74 isoform X1 n=1 Tax=Hylaeus volcanicus TaxID=313075 RepID=UPI0023B8394C|nr:WD repeat-containing protein 74 isoform X1 [Hylaeus volcanicus]